MPAHVQTFFEKATCTCTHVVICPETKKCAIIDPVLDFTPEDGCICNEFSRKVEDFIAQENLEVEWILETHVHADHITSGAYLKNHFPNAKTAIGFNITKVQELFKKFFNVEKEFHTDGSAWCQLFEDGDDFKIGNLTVKVMYTPGHTPACVSYYLPDDAVFTGDTLFMPDMGTARCDFPLGSAKDLWDSIQRLLALPENVRVFVGHDYAPGGRDYAWESTIGEEKVANKHVKTGTAFEEFFKFRTDRDADLATPRLLLPSIQVNIRGGKLPPNEGNGVHYLKIPINQTGKTGGKPLPDGVV